jgi:hypothetical protein
LSLDDSSQGIYPREPRVDTAGGASDLRQGEEAVVCTVAPAQAAGKPVLVSAEPPDEAAAARVVNG